MEIEHGGVTGATSMIRNNRCTLLHARFTDDKREKSQERSGKNVEHGLPIGISPMRHQDASRNEGVNLAHLIDNMRL